MSELDNSSNNNAASKVSSINRKFPNLKTISQEELAKHSTDTDCWIVINGVVYDVTKYLGEHPGGPEVIKCSAGMDVSEDFEDIGHSLNARSLATQFAIGILEGKEETACGTVKEKKAADKPATSRTGEAKIILISIFVLVSACCYYFFRK